MPYALQDINKQNKQLSSINNKGAPITNPSFRIQVDEIKQTKMENHTVASPPASTHTSNTTEVAADCNCPKSKAVSTVTGILSSPGMEEDDVN